jgi:uncharacterized damage-inducible protein DinB
MAERDDLLDLLGTHRGFLRHTAGGLTDEQARARSTVSELTIGGLIKHVCRMETRWANFLERGTLALDFNEDAYAAHQASFVMTDDDSLLALLAEYETVAAHTDKLLGELDLDTDHGLPTTPWWPEGMRWSVRRVLLHVAAETAQHAGHADIIREAIDGQKTMG